MVRSLATEDFSLGIVDDSDPISDNTLAAFELTGNIPEPATGLLVVFGGKVLLL